MKAPKGPRCQQTVTTYHANGTHQCYHRAKLVVEDRRLCRIHAKAAIAAFRARNGSFGGTQ